MGFESQEERVTQEQSVELSGSSSVAVAEGGEGVEGKKVIEVGGKRFVLDRKKAEEVFAAKKVINGIDTMTFNLLPLKYQWAYDLYRNMKANHWEPEERRAAQRFRPVDYPDGNRLFLRGRGHCR